MQVHVGRQPVFDRHRRVVGYELLFRASAQSSAVQAGLDGEMATAQVLVTSFLGMGLSDVVGTKLAFVNVPRAFLTGALPLPFPPGSVVVELLEDVAADAEVLAGVDRLVQSGYAIALDDVTEALLDEPGRDRLLELASYVKIDLRAVPADRLAALVVRCAGPGRVLVAEKVETAEEFTACIGLGIELYQGYHFARPQTLSGEALTPGRVAGLQMVALLNDPESTEESILMLLKRDAGLCYRLLQATNSASAGLRHSVRSVEQALVLVGRRTLTGWLVLMLLAHGEAADQGDIEREALSRVLTHARLCELLAARSPGPDPAAAFLLGLVDALSEVLEVAVPVLARSLALDSGLQEALLSGTGPVGAILTAARAYREELSAAPGAATGTDSDTAQTFLTATAWSQQLGSSLPAEPPR